jgi:hypothetical protein
LSYAQSDVPSIENPVFTIYPNPAEDFLIIRSEFPGNIELFNSIGKLMYQNVSVEFSSRIDISDFEDGVYIIRITSTEGVSRRKMVKN